MFTHFFSCIIIPVKFNADISFSALLIIPGGRSFILFTICFLLSFGKIICYHFDSARTASTSQVNYYMSRTKTVAASDKENEIFQEMKRELSKKKDALIEEIPTEKVNSFIDEHLESILLSFIGFALPIYIRSLKKQDLIAGNEFWSKLSLLLILPILVISFLLFLDFSKEKKFFRLLLTVPAFFSSLLFVTFLFSLSLAATVFVAPGFMMGGELDFLDELFGIVSYSL